MDSLKFQNLCRENGFTFSINGNIITIEKRFSPGDSTSFIDCDSIGPHILGQVPVIKSRSSVWGTDGGSVGGYFALNSGKYILNISGVKKSFMKNLSK